MTEFQDGDDVVVYLKNPTEQLRGTIYEINGQWVYVELYSGHMRWYGVEQLCRRDAVSLLGDLV